MATAKAPKFDLGFGKFGVADGDFPHGSRTPQRRKRDLVFLGWVKSAEKEDLEKALRDPAFLLGVLGDPAPKPPRWWEIAIERRLKMRADPRS